MDGDVSEQDHNNFSHHHVTNLLVTLMRTRKKELETIVELLSAEHDSVEDLAEELWKTVDAMRDTRDGYVIVVNHGHPLYLAYGIYDTVNAANKDIAKFKSTTGNERAYVISLTSPTVIFDDVFNNFK